MDIFNVECISDSQVFVRIKRFDGLFYNSFSQTFEKGSELNFDLVSGEGFDKNIWSAVPPIEITDEFPVGQYTVYYHSADGRVTAVYENIVNEKTPNELAMRVANIQIGEATLRFAINKIAKQIDEIYKSLKTNE